MTVVCEEERGRERGRVVPPLVSARQTPLLSLCGRTAFIERPQRGMFSNCPLETRITTDSERASEHSKLQPSCVFASLPTVTFTPLPLSLLKKANISCQENSVRDNLLSKTNEKFQLLNTYHFLERAGECSIEDFAKRASGRVLSST